MVAPLCGVVDVKAVAATAADWPFQWKKKKNVTKYAQMKNKTQQCEDAECRILFRSAFHKSGVARWHRTKA